MGCDAALNYIFLEIHTWCKWFGFNMEKLPNCKFLRITSGARLNYACGYSYVKINRNSFP